MTIKPCNIRQLPHWRSEGAEGQRFIAVKNWRNFLRVILKQRFIRSKVILEQSSRKFRGLRVISTHWKRHRAELTKKSVKHIFSKNVTNKLNAITHPHNKKYNKKAFFLQPIWIKHFGYPNQ